MIFGSNEDRIIASYFNGLNDTVGIIGLSLGVSLLRIPDPGFIPWIMLTILFFWALSKGGEYKNILKNMHKSSKPSFLFFLSHCWLFVLACALITSIGFELVTYEMFAGTQMYSIKP